MPGVVDVTLQRVEFPCDGCGRPLSAVPGTRRRKCAACGKRNTVPATSQPVASRDREPGFEGRHVVKTRRARGDLS